MEIFVARQPIFQKDKKIFGYELLFRESMDNFFSGIDGNTATSKLLSNTFMNIGIEKITDNKPAFINFTRDLLIRHIPQLFPKELLFVEVLEDVEPEEQVVNACKELSDQGYTIALDDFFYTSEMQPLIALANIIKFDFLSSPIEEISEVIDKIAGPNLTLLAEKVETNEEFVTALEMGFDYFQGYFFSKPEIIEGRDLSGAQMNLLEIMAEVNKPDFKFQKVEDIIARDVAITYKLMRYINSVFFRRVNKISTIKQAIVMLGEKGIRSFLSLIAMTKLGEGKPDELIRSSIIRAKFCELLGMNNQSNVNPSELFTLGLFSSIDAILNDSMENIMAKLPLSDNIKRALIDGEGELKDYLKFSLCYEKGDWKGFSEVKEAVVENEEEIPGYFFEALTWGDTITSL